MTPEQNLMSQIESCENTAKQQKLCKVKIFQLQSMSKSIRCINKRFVFKISVNLAPHYSSDS